MYQSKDQEELIILYSYTGIHSINYFRFIILIALFNCQASHTTNEYYFLL
jgi:hypothetical protein